MEPDASRRTKPLLVTLGDPCGIGPEIVVRAAQAGALDDAVVVGSVAAVRRAAAACGATVPIVQMAAPHLPGLPGAMTVWSPHGLADDPSEWPLGRVSAAGGRAAAQCIEAAAVAVLAGQGRALVTAPVHKEALAAAGVPYPGHTEMLQALAGGPPVRMMLANDELRVVLVTIHLALRRAIEAIDRAAVLETIRIAHRAAGAWGVARPRIAVAGLNPHAGEGGLFGDEERLHIAPAIAQARNEGMDASGPHPPDTVFMRARHAPPGRIGEFDLVVAMIHDHGLIPVKYLGVERGVNVTLGLPFVRTSPDHGTAFDIAGLGRADPASLLAALETARRLTSESS